MAKPKVYKNYIGGEWVNSQSGETFENINPADTGEVVGVFQKSNAQDVDAAISAAEEAYAKWRLVPAPKRGEMLYRVAQRLLKDKEAVSKDMTREMGKILAETRGDTQEAIDMTFYMAGEGRRAFGQTTPSEMPNKFCMSIRQPLGICGLITPWNFPIAIPSWKMMPALILGNTVVIKPATDTPLSVVHLLEALEAEGIPPGVVNLVTGSGSGVGEPLMKDKRIGCVSFTGSTEIGRKVSEACAPDFKHCHLEMGGKNAIIVMEDANIELAVDGALWGAFGTTGQRCTASSRLIIHKRVYNKFVDAFVERVKAIKVGNGLDETVQMGPAISESQMNSVLEYMRIGQEEDKATLLCGGGRLTGGDYDKGWFTQPTVFGDVEPGMRIFKEEIFGSVTDCIPADSFEDAVAKANDCAYGLSASIYTQNVDWAFAAMRDVFTGIFYVNAPTIGAETHLPFGGTKHTGNGHREACTQALEVFSEWKSVYIDFSGTIQRAQIDNQ